MLSALIEVKHVSYLSFKGFRGGLIRNLLTQASRLLWRLWSPCTLPFSYQL